MSRERGVTFSLSGSRAEAAARDLLSMGWFEAELERRSESPNVPASVVHARVLAIAAGSVTIADELLGWWDRWRSVDDGPAPLEVTLEAPTGVKASLATVTRDTLVDALRSLHLPRR